MKNKVDNVLELVPKNQASNETEEESLQKQEESLKVKEGKNKNNPAAGNGGDDGWNSPEWGKIAIHTVTALAIGGVDTFFYHIDAPPEVKIMLIVINVVYIMKILAK